MKNFIFFMATSLCMSVMYAQTVFINEIHYDNDGVDVNEAIEIAGPAGTSLASWTVVLYDGANGNAYSTINLSGVISNLENGYGAINFSANGMQNGAPDGIALVNDIGVVIQFLSYEGSFTAVSGPATGLLSTNIGVFETGATAVGSSLQLSGLGYLYEHFSWSAALPNSYNVVNSEQAFIPPSPDCQTAFSIGCGDSVGGSTVNGLIPSITTCGTSISSQGVWYRYSSSSIGTITASTCGNADYDTKISIFRNNCSNLICVGGNDDGAGCAGNTSEITLDVLANEEYFILVHGFQSQSGNFVLSLTCGPRAICQGVTVGLDANGMAGVSTGDIDAGSDSPNGIQSLTLDTSSFDCSNLGVNTVILTVTDNAGETDQCTATVVVEDNLVPSISTLGFLDVFLDVNGQVTVNPMDVDFGSTDNCGIDTFTLDVSTFDCSDIGVNNITLTVTDASGNSDSGTSIINVVDNLPPQIILQNITVTLDGNNQATITPASIDNGTTDNCTLATTSISISSFDCSHLGPNTVTFTAEDAIGNSSFATATVNVVEITVPVVFTQDISVSLDPNGMASITPSDINNGSSDNCAIDMMSLDVSTFDCTNLGVNTVTLTVLDISGNSNSATANVTIEDNLPPIAIAQAVILNLDVNGNATLTAVDVDSGSNDNCGIQSMSINGPGSYTCADIGSFNVVLTVEDTSGNISTASAPLNVLDAMIPTVITQNITVALGSSGNIAIAPMDIDGGSTDNCGIATLSLDIADFDCSDLGDNNVVLSVTDTSGNIGSGIGIISIIDDLAPNVIGQDITVDLAGNSSITILPTDVDNGTTDNCDFSLSLDQDTFNVIGTFPVILTALDDSGNIDTTQVLVTVVDTLGLVDEAYSKQIKLYPNPTNSEIYIETTLILEGIQVYDSSGKLVRSYLTNLLNMNVAQLESGVYFLVFVTDNSIITKRLIKN